MKRTISLFLALTLVLCACGQKTEEPATWQEQYDLGLRYLSEGEYEQAILAFEAAIEIDPKQADAYIGLAEVYVAQGNVDKAVATLERALECEENRQVSDLLSRLQQDSDDRAEEVPGDELLPDDEDDQSGREPLVGPVGTLELSDLSYTYTPGGSIVEDNEGAVGGLSLSFTVNGPEPVRDVLIATWFEEPPTQEEIDHMVEWIIGIWKENGLSTYNTGLPFRVEETTRPVDPEELGQRSYILLIGIDGNCNAVGYSVVPAEIPG